MASRERPLVSGTRKKTTIHAMPCNVAYTSIAPPRVSVPTRVSAVEVTSRFDPHSAAACGPVAAGRILSGYTSDLISHPTTCMPPVWKTMNAGSMASAGHRLGWLSETMNKQTEQRDRDRRAGQHGQHQPPAADPVDQRLADQSHHHVHDTDIDIGPQ